MSITKKPWWDYLGHDLRELLTQSIMLTSLAEEMKTRLPSSREEFHDYAFVVFPASKAYEGFLKKLFLDMGFITQNDYDGKRFRIGKALNPSLNRKKYKGQSVYDKITNYCGGDDLAKQLWRTWKNCRNLLFHWFPKEKNVIDHDEAIECVKMIIAAIDESFRSCKIKPELQNEQENRVAEKFN